jgi:hypothetical protein
MDQLRPDKDFVYPLLDSATADDDSLVALFNVNDIPVELVQSLPQRARDILRSAKAATGSGAPADDWWSVNLPAEDLPLAIIDGELGTVVYAPEPLTWPALNKARDPLPWDKDPSKRWDDIARKERFSNVPTCPIEVPDPTPYPPSDEEGEQLLADEPEFGQRVNPAVRGDLVPHEQAGDAGVELDEPADDAVKGDADDPPPKREQARVPAQPRPRQAAKKVAKKIAAKKIAARVQ